MGQAALNAIEAKLLADIVQGHRQKLGDRNLIRLSRLRLIMLQGTSLFVPTALGYDWYRQYMEQMHGNDKEGGPQGAS